MNRLISITLVCLLDISLAVASTFNLRVEVTPNGSGTLNTSGGTYEEGSTVYLRTYGNTGYVFKGWYEGETLLSSSTGFNYTMPSTDALVTARYEYDPEVPGNPAMPDTTTYYTLTATVSPIGAGSLNTYNGRFAAGATVYMRTYGNTGYQFVGWQNKEGETVSTSSSFNYTMPRGDSELTALYVYDPTVPANPDSMATRYTVTVACKPVGGGSFNTTSATVEEGGNVHLYAYTNTGYHFLRWENEAGETLSTEQNFYYVMPHGDSKLFGVFEFDPAVPANPNKNYWNKDLGEVIVDDFTPGYLGSAVWSAINGSDRSDVAMITVAGRMNDNDFGIANDFTNCTLLDLSRVTGVTQIPSYAFDYTNLESVCLPATIEKIGYRAFYECRQLSSLVIYAMTPPTLENNVFTNVPEGLVVYVPAAAITQYQEAAGWKDFTILPIQEDIRSLTISLPEGTNAADYAQMWLELTNTKSGQRMHYVMTDRQQYTFANIIRNTSWNVTLRNERGDVFGQIDHVEVKDEDVSVVFSSLTKPQNVSLVVKKPDGQDVTAQMQITWTDAQGNYVAQGASLTGLPVGYQANYHVALSQELAMQYITPQTVEYVLKDGGNSIVYQLEAIKQLQISGKVKDAATGLPLSGATVSASQTFGGKYSKTLNAKTGNNGVFTLTIANVPTSVAFAASDYVSQTVDLSNYELSELNEFAVPDVSLKSITGATINIGFTYTPVEGEAQNWYSDYQNVSYTLYNITREKPISLFNVQYPQIVLLEEVEDGDVLRMTATSRTNAFKPVETTATIAEQKAEATFGIVELGQIRSTFTSTGNASVVGSLYDATGKLVKTYDYTNASLTISNLADGLYTMVTMGSSRLYNTIYDLAQLPQTGLEEGADYVQNSVEVKSGQVSIISISEVPTFDESKLYYTGDNTSFTVNKPSIVAGNYLTLTGRIDFKPAYATNVSNVQMIVDLPESCEFVENSVMVGNSTSSYTLNGHQITIPMARYTDRVRFCIIPTLGGDYAPSAFAQFDLNGETVTQPIGSANYTAKDLSISVPSTLAKTTIPVSGTAIGISNVEIYDNDVLIGQTTSLANGTWATTCELNEPYNLSHHQIYAKVKTKQGIELTSENVSCIYDMNAIQVSVVKMYHDNPELHKTYELTFDFLNPSNKEENYIYYIYNKKFTFTIDFTNNDTTKVSNVVLYVKTAKSGWHPLEATYDAKQDKWVAAGEFGNMYDGDLPVNVSVDYSASSLLKIDYEKLNEPFELHQSIQKEFLSENNLIESVFSSKDQDTIDSYMTSLGYSDDYWMQFVNSDSLSLLLDAMTDSEKEAFIAQFFFELEQNDTIKNRLENLELGFDYNENWTEISVGDAIYRRSVYNNIDSLSLISEGFEAYISDNNSIIYLKSTEEGFEWIDSKEHFRYSCIYPNSSLRLLARRSGGNALTAEDLRQWIKSINDKLDYVKGLFERLQKTLDDVLEPLVKEQARLGREKGTLTILKKKCNPAMLHIYNQQIQDIDKKLALLRNGIRAVKKVTKAVAKYMPVAKYALVASDAIIGLNKLYNVYKSIPDPCKEDQGKASEYQVDVAQKAGYTFSYYMFYLGFDVSVTVTNVTQAAAGLATGGSTLVTAIIGELAKMGAEALADYIKDRSLTHYISEMNKKIDNLECNKRPCPGGNCPPPDGDNGNGGHPSNNPDKKFGIDPSGYVYEGVMANRVEGVTATIYYKENIEDMYGDLHENIVKWDAEEYAQENPLFTDENGYYRWDVPQGLWQVKFEKEGYETTYSEWLPVPPPQLDVNIAMKQNRQPEVRAAHAYEDAVEMEFDKYMLPELLTTENIMVMQNGTAVEGTVELLNEEVSYEGEAETFASKIRFNAAQPFTEQEITLLVNNRVKSYAGIRMQDNYQQTFTIEQEIKQIVSDSIVTVGYGNVSTLTVSVLPASASKGKMLTVKTSSPMILGVETEQVTIGNDGKAEITVSGELPGTAALTFTVEGTDKTATTIANVEQIAIKTVATPKASIASGSTVEKGTAITLTCETEGATIYYTLDGSCPCDNTDARKVYDGTPIIINETTTIKAMAMASDMYESEVAEFTYIVDGTGIDGITVNDQIQIYPLPVHDKVNISAGGKAIKSVTISSMNGVVVASANKPATTVTLDVSGIPTGIYIINVTTVDSTFSRKILKVE